MSCGSLSVWRGGGRAGVSRLQGLRVGGRGGVTWQCCQYMLCRHRRHRCAVTDQMHMHHRLAEAQAQVQVAWLSQACAPSRPPGPVAQPLGGL
jgi:hypothetical protein